MGVGGRLMAGAWGSSWGSSWGSAWGVTTPSQVVLVQSPTRLLRMLRVGKAGDTLAFEEILCGSDRRVQSLVGATVTLTGTEAPDQDIRCPACNARLGLASSFLADPPLIEKIRARRLPG